MSQEPREMGTGNIEKLCVGPVALSNGQHVQLSYSKYITIYGFPCVFLTGVPLVLKPTCGEERACLASSPRSDCFQLPEMFQQERPSDCFPFFATVKASFCKEKQCARLPCAQPPREAMQSFKVERLSLFCL